MKPLTALFDLSRISVNARFYLATVALGLLMTGPFVLTVGVVYLDMPESERHDVVRLLAPHLPTGILLTLFGFVAGLVLLRKLFRSYVKGLGQMAEQLHIMHEANREFRIALSGPLEVRAVAGAANQLADQRDRLLADVQSQVHQAQLVVESDRSRLAVLMKQLPVGVVVTNASGRVVLYNLRARDILVGSANKMGLGRSIYTVLSEMTLRQAQTQLAERVVQGEREPTLHLDLPGVVAETAYPVQLAPICSLDPEGSEAPTITGFVLTFQRQGLGAQSSPDPGGSNVGVPSPVRKTALPGWHHRPEFYDFDLFQNLDDAIESEVWRHKPLDSLSFTVFDTETTGLNPLLDQIIQIGAVRIWNRRLLTEEIFEQLVDPGRPIPKESTAIHGIQDVQVKGQPRIDPVLSDFHSFCADTVLIAHNAAFDLRFLQLRESQSGVRFLQPVLDTLLLSAYLHPEHEDHSLEAIATRLGVVCAGRHDAVQDAFITAQVFLKLLPLLMQRGIQTLEQALEASKKSRYARVQY